MKTIKTTYENDMGSGNLIIQSFSNFLSSNNQKVSMQLHSYIKRGLCQLVFIKTAKSNSLLTKTKNMMLTLITKKATWLKLFSTKLDLTDKIVNMLKSK